MRYAVTSLLWLNLESYYSAGLTPDQAKEVIESLRDPYSPSANLCCLPSSSDGNWRVETAALAQHQLTDVAERIERALELKLREMRKDA